MNWRTDKPTADVIVANHTDSDIYDILRRIDGKYYLYTMFGAREISIDEIKKWADLVEEEKIDKKIPLTNIDREEQISQVADILFYNTETAQLSIEKCYELAEKIVARGVNLREEETETDCNEYSTVEEELDAFIKSGKAIKEENCGTYTTTYIDPLKVARHFAKWGAEYRDRFLNYIRDLIKAGIKRSEEALNILKRIDTLINDNSLWAEHLKK